jgi:hypothetical protein
MREPRSSERGFLFVFLGMIDLTKYAANKRTAENLKKLIIDACEEQRQLCAGQFTDPDIALKIINTNTPEIVTSLKDQAVKDGKLFDK